MAEKQETTPKKALPVAEEQTPKQSPRDMVPIRLFYDGKEYKNRLTVRVNERRFSIKRGVDVMVPRFVKYVIEQSAKMDAIAQQNILAAEEAYLAKRV